LGSVPLVKNVRIDCSVRNSGPQRWCSLKNRRSANLTYCRCCAKSLLSLSPAVKSKVAQRRVE
jgi:hypothetical protein